MTRRGTTTTGRDAPYRSPKERAADGRAARAGVPRSAHAEFTPAARRADPVDLVERQSSARVPDLVPIRYGRMTESPFRFYRGAAGIMAADLAGTPATGIRTQLCGDAHLLNFRFLASPERHLLFDLNDFDETLPGPWEWDVKRLAASLVIAARANGFTGAEREVIVRAAVRSYRERMRMFAGMSNLAVWYIQPDVDSFQAMAASRLTKPTRRRLSTAADRARRRDTLQAADKLTHLDDGNPRITAEPPLIVPVRDLLTDAQRRRFEGKMIDLVERYIATLQTDRRFLLRQYRVVDMARKVVGVGSVGTRCWVLLLLGKDDDDPMLLQAKEAGTSVLAPHVGRSEYATEGERVVAGQRLMQAASDIFLGWERVEGFDGRRRDFYIRQLRDWKGIAMPEKMDPYELGRFGELCGATLARAHARSGDRIAIAAYLGGGDVFDRAVARFAEKYADQNERDHRALVDAVHTGRVTAEAA